MPTYRRGDRGPVVTRLEIALQELGLYRLGLDDVYGPAMEAAVRDYQERRGLAATGVADEETVARILAEPSPVAAALAGASTEHRSLSLTAGFETSALPPDSFSGLAGDFDGQGISFGALQWNLGQGTLQRLLRDVDASDPQVITDAFGAGAAELREVLGRPKAAQLAWARGIQTATRRSLVEPWRSRFRALGRAPECQAAQVRAAEALFARARDLTREYGLGSRRALALMFDIVVQNGSISTATRDRILAEFDTIDVGDPAAREVERMKIVANRRAEAARARFVEDVRQRKLTIATGVGVVHGRGYDLGRQYGLGLEAFDASPAVAPPLPS